MSAAISPGMWVEYVGNPWSDYAERAAGAFPVRGRIYRVRELRDRVNCGPGGIRPGLRLCGFRVTSLRDGRECSWPLEAVRPIYRPRKHAFDHLLTDLPADLDALEPALAAPRGRAPRQVHPQFRDDLTQSFDGKAA